MSLGECWVLGLAVHCVWGMMFFRSISAVRKRGGRFQCTETVNQDCGAKPVHMLTCGVSGGVWVCVWESVDVCSVRIMCLVTTTHFNEVPQKQSFFHHTQLHHTLVACTVSNFGLISSPFLLHYTKYYVKWHVYNKSVGQICETCDSTDMSRGWTFHFL